MAKKVYIKPEIVEESYILTVRAWVTQVTTTNVALVEEYVTVSIASAEIVDAVTENNVALHNNFTNVNIAYQEAVAARTARLAEKYYAQQEA